MGHLNPPECRSSSCVFTKANKHFGRSVGFYYLGLCGSRWRVTHGNTSSIWATLQGLLIALPCGSVGTHSAAAGYRLSVLVEDLMYLRPSKVNPNTGSIHCIYPSAPATCHLVKYHWPCPEFKKRKTETNSNSFMLIFFNLATWKTESCRGCWFLPRRTSVHLNNPKSWTGWTTSCSLQTNRAATITWLINQTIDTLCFKVFQFWTIGWTEDREKRGDWLMILWRQWAETSDIFTNMQLFHSIGHLCIHCEFLLRPWISWTARQKALCPAVMWRGTHRTNMKR